MPQGAADGPGAQSRHGRRLFQEDAQQRRLVAAGCPGPPGVEQDPGEALRIAEQILNGDPTNSGAHKLVVEAATALELPKTAVMSLEILASNSPKDRDVAIKFAKALADSGQVGKAEKILADLYRSFPTDNELAQALKDLSARKTLDEGGYEALADGSGSQN